MRDNSQNRRTAVISADTNSSDTVALLDSLVDEYNSIDRNQPIQLDSYFWSAHEIICNLYREGRIFIYAGDCEFEYLKTVMRQDGPEYAQLILFGTDEEHFYEIGVCVRGTPLLKRFPRNKTEEARFIGNLGNRKIGIYFDGTSIDHSTEPKETVSKKPAVKEILKGIAEILAELALYMFLYALGMGLFRLIGGTKFASDLLSESEHAVIIGIIIVLLLCLLACGVIYCVQKIKRYIKKKSKEKSEDSL